jgi:hypothetical protein
MSYDIDTKNTYQRACLFGILLVVLLCNKNKKYEFKY